MPFDGSAGFGPSTLEKERQFGLIMAAHMASTQAVIAKWARQGWRCHHAYLYWDLHAGPGLLHYYDAVIEGSPLLALSQAAALNLTFSAGLFEQDPAAVVRLHAALAQWRGVHHNVLGRVRIVAGDHAVTVPPILARAQQLGRPAFGLVYADPNGDCLPDAVLQSIAQAPHLGHLDFLCYVSATVYKRIRGAFGTERYLEDDVRALGKPYVWIRPPMDRQQWTFIGASAWDECPFPGSLGFVRWDSAAGRAVMERLNLSTRERERERQEVLV